MKKIYLKETATRVQDLHRRRIWGKISLEDARNYAKEHVAAMATLGRVLLMDNQIKYWTLVNFLRTWHVQEGIPLTKQYLGLYYIVHRKHDIWHRMIWWQKMWQASKMKQYNMIFFIVLVQNSYGEFRQNDKTQSLDILVVLGGEGITTKDGVAVIQLVYYKEIEAREMLQNIRKKERILVHQNHYKKNKIYIYYFFTDLRDITLKNDVSCFNLYIYTAHTATVALEMLLFGLGITWVSHL
ncbi:hypothetical protein ACJX0J_028474 [Zea mays]